MARDLVEGQLQFVVLTTQYRHTRKGRIQTGVRVDLLYHVQSGAVRCFGLPKCAGSTFSLEDLRQIEWAERI